MSHQTQPMPSDLALARKRIEVLEDEVRLWKVRAKGAGAIDRALAALGGNRGRLSARQGAATELIRALADDVESNHGNDTGARLEAEAAGLSSEEIDGLLDAAGACLRANAVTRIARGKPMTIGSHQTTIGALVLLCTLLGACADEPCASPEAAEAAGKAFAQCVQAPRTGSIAWRCGDASFESHCRKHK